MVEYLDILKGSIDLTTSYSENAIELPVQVPNGYKSSVFILHKIELEFDTPSGDGGYVRICLTKDSKGSTEPHLNTSGVIVKQGWRRELNTSGEVVEKSVKEISFTESAAKLLLADKTIYIGGIASAATSIYFRILYTVRQVSNRAYYMALQDK